MFDVLLLSLHRELEFGFIIEFKAVFEVPRNLLGGFSINISLPVRIAVYHNRVIVTLLGFRNAP